MSDSLLGDGNVAPVGGAQTPPPAEGGTQTPPSDYQGPEWAKGIDGIDPDILMDPSLKAFKDLPSVVKSYVHAQRKMGADKIILPNKNSTREEWLGLYQKLGLPTDFKEYSFEAPEKQVFDEDLLNKFKEVAYQNNLLPEQAKGLYDFLNNYTAEKAEALEADQSGAVEQAINGLKEEWGDAFDQNVRKAKLAVLEFGGDDLKNYLNETGLGNDPQLIKAFSKIGDSFFKEDKFEGESKPAYAMSPDEAQAKINQIQGEFNGPYYNPMHPDHKRTVDEVNKLFQITYRK